MNDRPIEIDGFNFNVDSAPQPTKSAQPKPQAPKSQPRSGIDVDLEGAARAKTDEAAARAAGFSPKPPIYQIGTLVNQLGVENFHASRSAFEKKASLSEAVHNLTEVIAAERRSDRRVELPQLQMLPNGMLGTRSMQGKNAPVALTERGLETLCNQLMTEHGLSTAGSRYLTNCPPSLRAENLNHWLPRQLRKRSSTTKEGNITTEILNREATIRCRRRADGSPEIFAVGGPRYTAYDVDKVAQAAERALKGVGDARCDVTYDGYRATMDVLWHTNVQPQKAVAGEIFKVGLRIKAADDGSGGINVSMCLERNLCLNLIIIDFNKLLVGRRRHVGKVETIEATIEQYLDASRERLGHFIRAWDNATAEDVLERYNLHDVDEVIEGLVRNRVVWVAGVDADEMQVRLRRAWDKEPGYSRTAFLNAITRAAHEEEWQRWSDVEDLESKAGELLFQKVWNCIPPKDDVDPSTLLEF